MLLTILGVLVILVIAALAVAASRPDSFRVERSIVVNAPPDRLFPLVDDFRAWGS